MLNKNAKPFMTALAFTVFSFLLLTYQNCAKPLEEIGMSSSLGVGSCTLTTSAPAATLNTPFSISYSYSPSSYRIRLVTMNNNSGLFTENIYTQSGTVQVTYTQSGEQGNYTVYGVIEDHAGNSVGNCQAGYNVGSTTTTPPPTTPPPTITLAGNGTSCVSSCTLNLTHTAANLTNSGKVFKIVRNGTTASDVACRSTDGAETTAVSLSYAANPGLNSFVAYLVPTCATATAGAYAAATFNVNVTANAVTYTWIVGEYGACSATVCGITGTRTRSVICQRSDGQTVADSFCSGTKPVTSQSCTRLGCGVQNPNCPINQYCPIQ